MLNFIASCSGTIAASGYTGLSSAICGFCHITLPPQYHGFQYGICPYSTTFFSTAP